MKGFKQSLLHTPSHMHAHNHTLNTSLLLPHRMISKQVNEHKDSISSWQWWHQCNPLPLTMVDR